ncbi:MAG: DUF4340 domain-containing protein [Ruminococcaceae bacterium]|nr:DUF4340 domain-containing protein [Oscillospiraceae bacterium]
MSKRLRTIIISSVAVLLLLAAVLVVGLLPQNLGQSSSQNASSSISQNDVPDEYGEIPIYAFNSDQLLMAEVENKLGGFTLVKKGEDKYVLEGMEDYALNSDSVTAITTNAAQLSATKLISEHPDDLEPYGLAEPIAKVKLSFDTGEVVEIWIGETSATGSKYIYIKSSDKIYLTYGGWSSVFEYRYTFYLDMTVVDDIETDEDGKDIDPHVKKISYFGKGLKTPIILEENPEYIAEVERLDAVEDGEKVEAKVLPAQYVFLSPFKADASNDSFAGKQYDYFGLTAEEIYSPNPTAKDFKDCGLDDPYMNIELVTAKRTIKIKLGGTLTYNEKPCFYVSSSDRDSIFIVSSEYFTFFKEDMIDYMSAIVVNVMIDDIKDLTIQHGKDKYVFETTGEGEDLVIRYNGKKLSTSEYRDLYQLIMLVYCEESVEPGQYKGDGDFTITYTYRDKEKVDVVEYVKVASRKYMIRLNGSDLGLVRSKYVDTLALGITEFINGRDVPSTY